MPTNRIGTIPELPIRQKPLQRVATKVLARSLKMTISILPHTVSLDLNNLESRKKIYLWAEKTLSENATRREMKLTVHEQLLTKEELKMRKVTLTITAIFLSTLLIACASQDTIKKGQADAKKPVNCATAEGDIRTLQSEKTHTSQQMAAGVSAIAPAGIVVGTVTGQEITNAKVATGDYNKMLDNRIAEIKQQCGLK